MVNSPEADVFESKIKMIKALNALQNAWKECEKSFSESTINCNDYIAEKYPFIHSFDEVTVDEWVNISIDKLQTSIDEAVK